jgi:hypothetical protein
VTSLSSQLLSLETEISLPAKKLSSGR